MNSFTKYIKQIVYGLGVVIVVLLFLLITINTQPVDDDLARGKIVFNDIEFVVEIVDTPELRAQGLSLREVLSLNTGMLFVFSESDKHGFWMKDMLFPIDIIWFDDEFVVVDVKENLAPESYPEVFKPRVPARFALEINISGISDNDIVVGKKAIYESL